MTTELELTDEMIARNDTIDNAVYQVILTLTEKTDEELPWNMEIIGNATDAIKSFLLRELGLQVRHPGVVTNEDGSQEYSDYDVDDFSTKGIGIYTIDITETLSRGVDVKASTSEEAIEMVMDAYDAEEYVLDSEDFTAPASFEVSAWSPVEEQEQT